MDSAFGAGEKLAKRRRDPAARRFPRQAPTVTP